MSEELLRRPAAEIAAAVRAGRARAIDIVEAALAAIAADQLGAFVHVDPDGARRSAGAIDAAVDAGHDVGPLAGVPIGVKDLEDCAGMPTRCGSLLLADATPAVGDSVLVARLRAAGAIPVGKTASAEFGCDSVTATRLHGVTRNPWAPDRTPGGSSGGSAAAVSAGLVPLATGSDAGGSLREPAAYCGLVGLKPTHGLLGRSTSSAIVVSGVLATTVADVAIALDAAAGPHLRDRWSLPSSPLRLADGVADQSTLRRPLRARFSADLGYAATDPETVALARSAATRLAAAAGFELDEQPVRLPDGRGPWLALAGHAVRHELERLAPWPELLEQLCPTTAWCALHGDAQSTADLAAAERACGELELALAELLGEIDLLITPSTACPPFAAEGPIPVVIGGENAGLSGAEPFGPLPNLTGTPAISLPAGLTTDGLPVGVQLLGARGTDGLLLSVAAAGEAADPWPRLAPARVDVPVSTSRRGTPSVA
ncbi:amidase [Nonomuraea sp. NPDC046570]|uniref:amidase n=1 Tax=Nonomuraea sp. NPDC046570 TaxID=3155255 RepID=UPI0033F5BF79